MPLRFRRSIRILPGLRVNLGKRGASVSVGVRGAHVTFGKTGTRTTVGLPGTGVSYTHVTPPATTPRPDVDRLPDAHAQGRNGGFLGIVGLLVFAAFIAWLIHVVYVSQP